VAAHLRSRRYEQEIIMRRLAIAVLSFAVVAGGADAQTADDCYQATLKTDDREIIRICTAALAKGGMSEQDRSITVSNRGLGYLRDKQYDKAIIDFSDALVIDSRNPFPFNFRGEAWREKGNQDRALADFAEALRIDTAFTAAIYNRGLSFERQNNVTAARAEYRRALATKGTRALDQWARDRAQERLTALGDNPPQQPQQPPQQRQPQQNNETGERDLGPSNTDRNRNNDNSGGSEGVRRRN
jgi:tetratricopeptide (TPR) repeat protein